MDMGHMGHHFLIKNLFPAESNGVHLAPANTHDSPAHLSHPHSRCPHRTPRSGGCTCHCHSESPEGNRWATLSPGEEGKSVSISQATLHQISFPSPLILTLPHELLFLPPADGGARHKLQLERVAEENVMREEATGQWKNNPENSKPLRKP
jgi:hypothetical protein